MGLRYKIPFVDHNDTSYFVEVYREGYTGRPAELVGAPSCFVVSGTDDDFMYVPMRNTSATLRVIDSELLLDLYSINNQYAAVKLYKEGVLEWTGYVKPEQFTQPYVPNAESVSVDCVGALSTLEYIEYKEQTETGYIVLFNLLKHLVSSTKGGYRGVYIPAVYGKNEDALKKIVLCEENFTSEEMNLKEVLEAVCKFLNWTVCEHGGFLWFVDADWKGIYRLYDEALTAYEETQGAEVLVQNVGFLGSDSNTLDVIHGYNKATVKSVNNVFDEVIDEEPYDILEVVQTWEWDEGQKEDALQAVRKFKKPMLWKMFYYDHHMNALTQEQIASLDINTDVVGGVECSDLGYRITEKDGEWVPKDKEFNWEDTIKVRLSMYEYIINGGNDRYKAFTVKGVNSVWKDGAFGVNMNIRHTTGPEMVYTAQTVINTDLFFMLRIGDHYYNGSGWVNSYSTFKIRHNVSTGSGYQPIKSNLNALMPYRGLQGYVIELPQDRVLIGEFEFTMFINDPGDSTISGYFIKDFRLDYAKKEGVNNEGESGDRIYENVVNEAYMSECDEITFEIGSYNEDGATYSKALLGEKFLKNDLYCAVVDENVRPEELMIRRIVNRYGETKIKLTEGIKMTGEINPFAIIRERTQPDKIFRLTSGEWDYERGRLAVQIQEDAE